MLKFLKKTFLGKKILSLFERGTVDEALIEECEKLLFEADLGASVASDLTEKMRSFFKREAHAKAADALALMEREMVKAFLPTTSPAHTTKPHVILVVGVNGNGKTTTVAKLAHHYKMQGKKVLLGACDTFRAAGSDQLEILANRLQVDLVKGQSGSDSAAVAFDAITAATKRGHDVVIIDTAGRLHNRDDLMGELAKIRRVIDKAQRGAPHETLLILDATTGQNGLFQATTFHASTPLTGLILTKLDGTAKGGIAIAIQKTLRLPILFAGTGEGLTDLIPFDPPTFVSSLLDPS